MCAAGEQGLYLSYLQKPECLVAQPVVATGTEAVNCADPNYPLNGSAANMYNSTSYYDDLTWGALWMYRWVQPPSTLNPKPSLLCMYNWAPTSLLAVDLLCCMQ